MMTNERGRLRAPALWSVLLATAVLAACGSDDDDDPPPPVDETVVTDPAYPGVVCKTVQMPTRDDVLLTTFVYLPESPSKHPVVLQRNPYGRGGSDDCFAGSSRNMAFWAQNGYVGVHQETRGTYTSEGTFEPNVQEAEDGYDAIEWAAAQEWSDGKVATTGGSYLGLTQWQPAIHTPPSLVAMAPGITTSDLHDSWLYDNGVFLPWGSMYWIAATFMPDAITRRGQAQGLPQAEIDAQVANWQARVRNEMMSDWLWQLPLTSFSEYREYAPYYYDWLENPNYAGYWASMDVETRYANVKVPTLNTGAWYDPFQIGTVRNYLGMRSAGGSEQARSGARLVMSAYGHSGDSKTPTFGSDTFDPDYTLRFFDHYVKGIDNGINREAPVHLYVLVPPDAGTEGSGFWISGEDYPLPGTSYRRFYLASNGDANTRMGGGALTPTGSLGAPDHFTYDPRNPVPTTGGNYLNNPALLQAGAADQSTVELRNDVLVYTSAPLEEDLPVIGPVTVKFWAASSAVDTDFTAKLVDVHHDEFAHNVLDRVVRARFREGHKQPPKLIEPGTPYEYTLELGHTGTIFKKGHRVRLEISSSNFPRVARNLNTGAENPYADDQIVVAQQTILHDAEHPSFLELPVAPGVSMPAR
jgi:putative CocE/NonD family hydrolase